MNEQLTTPFIGFFVLGFPVLWLAIRWGWFDLMRAYPDPGEPVSAQFPGQSGSLNGVSLRRLLKLSGGPAGLRLGVLRLFGPSNRDVCVPWRNIAVTHTQRSLVGKVALGRPAIAVLTLPADVADDLARALPDHWPEAGPLPIETDGQIGWRIFQQWVLQTVLAATFFIVAPRLLRPHAIPPPIAVAILFPRRLRRGQYRALPAPTQGQAAPGVSPAPLAGARSFKDRLHPRRAELSRVLEL